MLVGINCYFHNPKPTDFDVMKNLTYFVWCLAFSALTLTSCSKEDPKDLDSSNFTAVEAPVIYTTIENEVMDLVNAYRAQSGLNQLQLLDENSRQAAIHNGHMIDNDEVCHDNFADRYTALVNTVQAKAVSENVAFGYSSAEAVVNAWIKSESHKKNMLGDHTHFGISIREGKDGRLYFTNIFVRK